MSREIILKSIQLEINYFRQVFEGRERDERETK